MNIFPLLIHKLINTAPSPLPFDLNDHWLITLLGGKLINLYAIKDHLDIIKSIGVQRVLSGGRAK